MKNQIIFNVAGFNILIRSSVSIKNINFEEVYNKFISKNKKAQILIQIHYGKLPKVSLQNKELSIGIKNLYKFYRSDGKYIFVLNSVKKKSTYNLEYIGCWPAKIFSPKAINIGPRPYRIAIFDTEFKKGTIYVKLSRALSYSNNLQISKPFLPDPLQSPLSELLIMNWLASDQGLLFHGCAVMNVDRGYLFLGHSGQGKSTMARLWQDQGIILHDDHIVLRKIKDCFLAFATPWYRQDVGTSEGVTVNKIFFLHHGLKNRAYRQNKSQALFSLLQYSYLPVWRRDGMEQVVEFCRQLAREIPCFLLDFVPNPRVLDYIKGLT